MTEDGLFGPRDNLEELAKVVYSMAHSEGMRVDVAVESVRIALDKQPDMDLAQFLRARCDVDPGKFLTLVDKAAEPSTDRDRVLAALRDMTPTANPPGRPKGNRSNTTVSERSSASGVLARLKRDHPHLAQQVIAGELTAHAAAVQAGIRRRRVSVVTDDPHQAIATLLRHYTADQLLEALDD